MMHRCSSDRSSGKQLPLFFLAIYPSIYLFLDIYLLWPVYNNNKIVKSMALYIFPFTPPSPRQQLATLTFVIIENHKQLIRFEPERERTKFLPSP